MLDWKERRRLQPGNNGSVEENQNIISARNRPIQTEFDILYERGHFISINFIQ